MPRRHLRLVLALLLPLMALRALLPAGTMPVAEDGGLRIVMCSAGLAQPGDDGDHELPPNAGDCPFAHAATLAPPSQPVIGPFTTPITVRFHSTRATTLPPATGPPRVASARAPPALSRNA